MQEDKTSKWFAASLRKQQEEDPLPYELGAWEAFEGKRKAIARKKTVYWISGIAASITLLLVAGGLWLSQDGENATPHVSGQMAMEDKVSSEKAETENSPRADQSIPESSNQAPMVADLNISKTKAPEGRNDTPKQLGKSVLTAKNQISAKTNSSIQISRSDEKSGLASKEKSAEIPPKSEVMESLIATQEKAGEEVTPKSSIAETEAIAEVLPEEPPLSDEEIKEILESKSFASLAMGVSPGFGSSQGSDQTTSGASLGLGVMVDMEITGKLVMGSGLAVNYLNQASESQSYAQVAGFASPVTEKNEIAQVQVDIPLYFKYPITRNQSISIQAGFSNLMTFNQNAETQSSYTRQVAVLDASFSGANAITLKSESVDQLSALDVPQNKFYPFATANFGVNIRLYESKKTSYLVMPFYNYPLQEFSGYGEKLGMFGASFKVNFGTIEKK